MVSSSVYPRPFMDGKHLIDGSYVNRVLDRPQWSTETNITATGANASNAWQLNAKINKVTGGVPGAGVVLPAGPLAPTAVEIWNESGGTLNVYSTDYGSTINGVIGTTAFAMGSGAKMIFTLISLKTWESASLGSGTTGSVVTSFNGRSGDILLTGTDITNAGGALTSQLANYATITQLNTMLPLAGGTMTGQLNGTSANFTGAVGAGSLNVSGNSVFSGNATVGPGCLYLGTANQCQICNPNNAGTLVVTANTGNNDIIVNTGAVVPQTDNVTSLGVSGKGWNSLFMNANGVMYFGQMCQITTDATNNVNLWLDSTNAIKANAPYFVPSADNNTSLGINGLAWKQLYMSNGANAYFGPNCQVGSAGVYYGNLILSATNEVSISSPNLVPQGDNAVGLGTASFRWTAVYAVNGTIQTSDSREKTDIQGCDLGSDFIRSIRPVSYRWKVNTTGTAHRHYGVIAQELELALAGREFGGLVKPATEDGRYGLQYSELVAPLIKTIQELLNRVDALEAEVLQLRGFEPDVE